MHPDIMRLLAASRIRDLITEADEARRARAATRGHRNRPPAQPRQSAPAIPANPPQQWSRHLARRGIATR